MGRVLRNALLLILAALWILPLYLFLINAAKTSDGYRSTERYVPREISRSSTIFRRPGRRPSWVRPLGAPRSTLLWALLWRLRLRRWRRMRLSP